MDKKELRNRLRIMRNSLPETDVKKFSQKITEQIVTSPWFVSAKTVLLYRAANNEVDTDTLWKICLDMGKICLFPKCISKTQMIAVRAENEQEFQEGMYGIREPLSNREFLQSEIDLILVPGLGFDKKKYRVGYGAGYYDRYLKDFSGVTCGLCYEKLICDTVFPKSHDVALSYIATETGIF